MMMFTARTIATNREFALGPALSKRAAQTAAVSDIFSSPLDNSGTKEERIVFVLLRGLLLL